MTRMDQEPHLDEPPPDLGERETEADAWEYWHQRAHKAEQDRHELLAVLQRMILNLDTDGPAAAIATLNTHGRAAIAKATTTNPS